jgi:hypothetical protein
LTFSFQKYIIQIITVQTFKENSYLSKVLKESKIEKCKCENNFVNIEVLSMLEANMKLISSYSSCNSISMIKRGFNQKVISVSINNLTDFEEVLKLSQNVPTNWSLRVYYDDKVISSDLKCYLLCDSKKVKNKNINFCPINSILKRSNNINNTFLWKWLPFGDPFIDYFISIDIKRVSIFKNIFLEINKWMNENKDILIVRGTKCF